MAEVSGRLNEAVAFFEQVLQIMPEDWCALEFLCIAYYELGEMEKFHRALVEFAGVVVREKDLETARYLLEFLEKHSEKEVKIAELRVRALLQPPPDLTPEKEPDAGARAEEEVVDPQAAIAAEIALVETLVGNRVIDGELGRRIIQQLQEFSGIGGGFLISALAILENENPVLAEAAVAFVADAVKTPPVAIEAFPEVANLVGGLPEALVRSRGVIPFGRLAGETMVAVANPLDEGLKRVVRSLLGVKCHFFLAPQLSLAIVLGRLFPENGRGKRS